MQAWWHSGNRAKENGGQSRSYNFFLKVGETRRVVFLEDVKNPEPGKVWPEDGTFGFWEHVIQLDGNYQAPFRVTCTRGFSPCLVCEKKWQGFDAKKGRIVEQAFGRHHINVVTVIDLTEWTDQNGALHRAQKRILPMKHEIYELLSGKSMKKRAAGDKKGLELWVYEVTRHSQKKNENEVSYSVGNDYEAVEKLDYQGLLVLTKPDIQEADLRPFDYPEVFKPTESATIEEWFRNYKVTQWRGRRGMTTQDAARPADAAASQTTGG